MNGSRVSSSVGLADGSTADKFKLENELADKLAWAYGSTFRATYGRRSKAFRWATFNAAALVCRWEERGEALVLPSLHASATASD